MLYYFDSSCQLDGYLTWCFPVDGKVFWWTFIEQLSLSLPGNETQQLLLPWNALPGFGQWEAHAEPCWALTSCASGLFHTKSGIFSWNGRTCHSLALSLLLASSACSSPHIQHTPCWRWRQSLCGVGGLLVLWDMTCANMSCNTVLLTAQPWCGKPVLSASLSSSERAQSLAFLCGVPLAQQIAQADPDTPEVELVYEKTLNYFNLNLKRR